MIDGRVTRPPARRAAHRNGTGIGAWITRYYPSMRALR